jgi:hypothetical protein
MFSTLSLQNYLDYCTYNSSILDKHEIGGTLSGMEKEKIHAVFRLLNTENEDRL